MAPKKNKRPHTKQKETIETYEGILDKPHTLLAEFLGLKEALLCDVVVLESDVGSSLKPDRIYALSL